MTTPILQQMADRVKERQTKYQTKIVRALPPIRRLNEPYMLGSFSVTLRSTRKRYLRKSAALPIGETLETPSTLARDYLALVYRKGPGLRSTQRTTIEGIIQRAPAFPLYAVPQTFDDGFYIDVRRAFFSVMLVAGWNVSYLPKKFIGKGRPPSDYPFQESSISRNSLVSVASSRMLVEYFPPNHKRHVLTTFNPLLNESISALIRDVLHSLANTAVRSGAIYCHTDGYIAPDENTANRLIQAVRDYGLEARIKARGPGAVWGVANYRVGDQVSLWEGRRDEYAGPFQGTLEIEYDRWLRNNFSVLAGRAKL